MKFEKNFTGMTDVLSNLPMLLAGVIAYVFGCISYVILGVQVVLTYVEFYLVCALLTVFVPFGVTKWTSFLAEKAIGGEIDGHVVFGGYYARCVKFIRAPNGC